MAGSDSYLEFDSAMTLETETDDYALYTTQESSSLMFPGSSSSWNKHVFVLKTDSYEGTLNLRELLLTQYFQKYFLEKSISPIQH